jgi:exonuclease III
MGQIKYNMFCLHNVGRNLGLRLQAENQDRRTHYKLIFMPVYRKWLKKQWTGKSMFSKGDLEILKGSEHKSITTKKVEVETQ